MGGGGGGRLSTLRNARKQMSALEAMGGDGTNPDLAKLFGGAGAGDLDLDALGAGAGAGAGAGLGQPGGRSPRRPAGRRVVTGGRRARRRRAAG